MTLPRTPRNQETAETQTRVCVPASVRGGPGKRRSDGVRADPPRLQRQSGSAGALGQGVPLWVLDPPPAEAVGAGVWGGNQGADGAPGSVVLPAGRQSSCLSLAFSAAVCLVKSAGVAKGGGTRSPTVSHLAGTGKAPTHGPGWTPRREAPLPLGPAVRNEDLHHRSCRVAGTLRAGPEWQGPGTLGWEHFMSWSWGCSCRCGHQ